MLNSSSVSKSSISNSINFNGVATGIIQKSHIKSWFRRMHTENPLAKMVFSDNPRIEYGESWNLEKIPIVVLQILLMSDKEIMVEMVKQSDL